MTLKNTEGLKFTAHFLTHFLTIFSNDKTLLLFKHKYNINCVSSLQILNTLLSVVVIDMLTL